MKLMADPQRPYAANGSFLPGNPGRRKGQLNKATVYIREFCRGIVESPEYQQSLVRRIMDDTLPPAVEVTLLYYAYGRPRDLEPDTRLALSGLTTDALVARAQELSRAALELKVTEDARSRALPPFAPEPPVIDAPGAQVEQTVAPVNRPENTDANEGCNSGCNHGCPPKGAICD
jgi:hypothetical protein